jgi:hypothetical protein
VARSTRNALVRAGQLKSALSLMVEDQLLPVFGRMAGGAGRTTVPGELVRMRIGMTANAVLGRSPISGRTTRWRMAPAARNRCVSPRKRESDRTVIEPNAFPVLHAVA